MLDSLAALKQRTKAQTAAARRTLVQNNGNDKYVSVEELHRQEIERQIEAEAESKRREKMERIRKASEILPTDSNETIARDTNESQLDSFSRIISEFRRQIDNSPDLRVMLADPEVTEEQPNDHPTVKFFKGVIDEWRIRLFSLPDEELASRKQELVIMWHCFFSLQPLFDGLNKHDLGRDISVETTEIANHLRKLDFNAAKTHYNNLAIGNNIWPIGITQYSIHWKFSLDLMDSERVLHLFNSEPARNAIISIKRLMSKYEEFHEKKNAL
ncbi:pre-mRNA-splicing factor 18-like [Histomonas meleagridis]|uniref:pre-mRNA-splicing factor 18-like n=1 Tax=Histomonas meleagridis TaxID=135588 RepID=UPI003559DC56|nr:pre-mRNA-splicing factor 18-like [Histomonas meleagridis]KAH0804492.1 pre-mRNA-splicing factor 18-like [Histomonas meleagridis]